MNRRFVTAGAALAVAVSTTLVAAPPASATPTTTGASAYASSAATGTGTLAASLTLTGAVGGLLNGVLSPIVNGALNPLVSALQGTVNSTVSAALGSSSTYNAGSPTQQSTSTPGTFPGDLPAGLPAPCGSSAITPCFQAGTLAIDSTPLATLGVNSLSGYTQQLQPSADPTNAIFGRAQITSPRITALAGISTLTNPIVSAGVVNAKATCPNATNTAPTASVSATSVSVLGGLITLNVLNGAVAGLVVNGTTYGTLASLPLLNVAGVAVQTFGTALRVDIPLTLDQLVAGLGLPTAAITELLNDASSASLKLSVIVGPTTSTTATTAKAAGLNVGLDLSGSVKFNLLGLAGASVAIPSAIGNGNYGNLLDARLGYATCQSGSSSTSTTAPAIPAGLI